MMYLSCKWVVFQKLICKVGWSTPILVITSFLRGFTHNSGEIFQCRYLTQCLGSRTSLKKPTYPRILTSEKILPPLPGIITTLVKADCLLSHGCCFSLLLCSVLDLRLPSLFVLCHLPAQPCPHPCVRYHLQSDSFSPSELIHRSIHNINICIAQNHLRLSMSKKKNK